MRKKSKVERIRQFPSHRCWKLTLKCSSTSGASGQQEEKSFWLSVRVQYITGLAALRDTLCMGGGKNEGHQETLVLLSSHKACGCTVELLATGSCGD